METTVVVTTPAWVIDPAKLTLALHHSVYLSNDVLDAVRPANLEAFSKGVSQFLFWKRQLIPSVTPRTIMFSLLGPEGLADLNVMEVLKALKAVMPLDNALEVYKGPDARVLAISFKSASDVLKIPDVFKFYEDKVVAYIMPESSDRFKYSILWLPPLFPVELVHSFLSTYSHDYSVQKGTIDVGDKQYLPTTVVRGQMALKSSKVITDLPHLIKLPAPHKGCTLLIVDGREPYCLKCREVGHLRKDCHAVKCRLCKAYHGSSVVCRRSYSSSVSGSGKDIDIDLWTALADDIALETQSEGVNLSSVVQVDLKKEPSKVGINSSIDVVAHHGLSSDDPKALDLRPLLDGESDKDVGPVAIISSKECDCTRLSQPEIFHVSESAAVLRGRRPSPGDEMGCLASCASSSVDVGIITSYSATSCPVHSPSDTSAAPAMAASGCLDEASDGTREVFFSPEVQSIDGDSDMELGAGGTGAIKRKLLSKAHDCSTSPSGNSEKSLSPPVHATRSSSASKVVRGKGSNEKPKKPKHRH